MKRKGLFATLILTISFVWGITINVQADVSDTNKYNLEEKYIKKWMELNGYGKTKISTPLELYSIDGDISAIKFDF